MSALLRGPNTSAFDGLYRRHAATVYRYSLAVLGNHADAEDVTQTTFMNAYRALAQGVKPRKAENWLLTIAHNQIRQHFRRTLGKPLEVELDETNARAQTQHEPDEPSVADVLRALQTLSPAQRSAIVMREFEGRPYAEIAEILGLTSSALEALLFRARRALAEQLEESLSCADAEVAVSRKLDGRLGRRENRKLKSHMRSCPTCSRFDQTQRKQRQLLKGLTVIPVPASLFLLRGETAAAVGFGAGAAATSGGVGAVGAGAGASGLAGTGIAAGMATSVAVKVAVVATAAVAVAGGAGYESTKASRTNVPPAQSSKVQLDAKLAQTRNGERSDAVRTARTAGLAPGPAATASDRGRAATTAAAARRAAARDRAAAALAQAKGPGSGRPASVATARGTPHPTPTHPTRPETGGQSATAKDAPPVTPTAAKAPTTGKPTTTPVVPPSPTRGTPPTKKAADTLPRADSDALDSPENAQPGPPATAGRK